MSHETLKVGLGPRSYDILVGGGLVGAAGVLMRPHLANRRVFIVTDRNVAAYYLAPLTAHLRSCGTDIAGEFVLEPGEKTKNFSEFTALVDKILSHRPSRQSTVIALGGGVVGDIAGFAASVILRGIQFIQIPTTLLAQVDSSVGGKTGINAAQGKNLIGSFYQPKLVICDVGVLKTLPRREVLAGYAEVLKYAIINDIKFFKWLDVNINKVLDLDLDVLTQAVRTSCAAKADIVARDEHETNGLRALLNFGHTFGHALEAIGGYDDRLLHGEAVAIGMRMAFNFSYYLNLCPDADIKTAEGHMDRAGLPKKPCFAVSKDAMISHMLNDKKAVDGRISLILAKSLGQAFKTDDVPLEQLDNFLEIYLKNW